MHELMMSVIEEIRNELTMYEEGLTMQKETLNKIIDIVMTNYDRFDN